MPVTALALQLLTALCNSGRNALDSAALGLLFEELRESSDNSEGSRIADAAP
jgi:hypothetical protein